MAKLQFKTLEFREETAQVKVIFMNIFYFYLEKDDLNKIGNFNLGKSFIDFDCSKKRAERKFNGLLSKGFENLKNKLNNKKTIYVHQNSAIPLIGSNAFGLIDRNTSVIEIRPITSCNLKCIYCSVDESKRIRDFVVEKDYLVSEFKKLIEYKGIDNIEAHIGTQGEPLLYSDIIELVKDVSKIKKVSMLSIDTNGVLLDEKMVDKLISAGLKRFNFSINSLDINNAKRIAGVEFYNSDSIKKILEYISQKDCELIISPVWIPGYNDSDIEDIIKFVKKIKCDIGIQNFLNYKLGKNPVKQMDMDDFFEKLKALERKHGIKLILNCEKDFKIVKTKKLPKPFKKGDSVLADYVCDGRLPNERIYTAKNRCITTTNCNKNKSKIKITRDKHNVFYGVC